MIFFLSQTSLVLTLQSTRSRKSPVRRANTPAVVTSLLTASVYFSVFLLPAVRENMRIHVQTTLSAPDDLSILNTRSCTTSVYSVYYFCKGLNGKITVVLILDKMQNPSILGILISRLLLYLSVYCPISCVIQHRQTHYGCIQFIFMVPLSITYNHTPYHMVFILFLSSRVFCNKKFLNI